MKPPGPKPPGAVTPPQVADHLVLRCIGRGSYGAVWLARNVLGSYRAVKVISRRDFRSGAPFEREFSGILKYEPVSRAHPGHVDILQVGRDETAGFFYYVMELADDATSRRPVAPEPPGEADAPAPAWLGAYEPRTLSTELRQHQRLPVADCVALGAALADALSHLHRHGLVHRDIKPANVIFVGGRPELADIGLVTESETVGATLGTEGFIAPDGAGTPAGDIYALGKVLYELSTGLDRKRYPELPADLAAWPDRKPFLAFNEILARACAARAAERYPAASELQADLAALRDGRNPRHSRAWPRGLRWAAGTLAAAALLIAGAVLSHRFRPPATGPPEPAPLLTAAEKAAGFRPLFDGATLEGWRYEPVGTNTGVTHWTVEHNAVVRAANTDPGWSRLVYAGPPLPRDFELRFEWRVAPGSQGGVFYLPGLFKYQLSDGASEVGTRANQRPASLFAMAGPTNDFSRPAGQWNEARIVRRGAQIEHWLNGQLAVKLDFTAPAIKTQFQEMESRFYGRGAYGTAASRRPQLRLLECGRPVAFRKLLIRPITTNPIAAAGSQARGGNDGRD